VYLFLEKGQFAAFVFLARVYDFVGVFLALNPLADGTLTLMSFYIYIYIYIYGFDLLGTVTSPRA
jgi:hypothetical protein